MRFSENRRLAKIVLVVCVLVSVFVFGGGGLKNERADILLVFAEGTDASLSTRHSMDAYLGRAAESAALLSQEAGIYLSGSTQAAKVSEGAEALKSLAGISERANAYEALKEDVELLYTEITAAKLSEAQMTNMKLAYYDFKGVVNLIGNDAYHSLAQSFNRKIARFPANFLGGLFGVTDLETFDG